jgi:predicted unusual protein kinase regulating ubiquinone biosynthesis (AarF/ABC1/UbiB family)
MKLGQVLSTYPNVVPEEFADLLGRLHFEAPPMHFSLLREQVRNELGADPEDLFETFETEAFAAASLGQVHRATMKGTGQNLAVKIQYPNIARTIHDDFRNMYLIMKPMRLSEDWDNILDQVQDIQRMLELETDYEQEAENLRLGRLAFREGDQIFIPKAIAELSSKRVLTMEFVEGVHLPKFLARQPSQEERNRFGNLMSLAALRLSYTAEICYADPQPGNYIFMPDGRLGLIDFGCIHHFTQQDIDYLNEAERAFRGKGKDVREVMVRVGGGLSERQRRDEDRMKLMIGWADWVWEPLFQEAAFDFSDESYFRRGMDMYSEMVRKRYTRSMPLNTWLARNFMGVRALLTRLKAEVDMGQLYRAETTIR